MRATRPRRTHAHAVLGLSAARAHTSSELRQAFYRKAKQLHPDAGGSASAFRELHDAYRTLQRSSNSSSSRVAASAATAAAAAATQANSNDSHNEHVTGFYTNAHSQWECSMAQRRRYWRAHYEQQQRQQQQQHSRHGSDGADVARDAGWSEAYVRWRASAAAYANYASWYAYRPYESSFASSLGHGFRAEELREAARRSRRARCVRVCTWAVLLAPLVWLVPALLHPRRHHLHDDDTRDDKPRSARVRAVPYHDEDYWRRVEHEGEDDSGSAPRQRRVLRNDATDSASLSSQHDEKDSGDVVNARAAATAATAAAVTTSRIRHDNDNKTSTTTTKSSNSSRRSRSRDASSRPHDVVRTRHDGWVGGALRYQGRPFTATHVRGVRGRADKTARTYTADKTCHVDDDDDGDEDNKGAGVAVV